MIIIEFLDFFAGIGCFRLGFEKAGFVCRGHCEIDKYANKSYYAMLQAEVPEKYFLSDEQTRRLLDKLLAELKASESMEPTD